MLGRGGNPPRMLKDVEPMHAVGSSIERPTLLVAAPWLKDPNFYRAVILLASHSKDGALGFVLNRPDTVPLCEILRIEGLKIPPSVHAWNGGPVDKTAGVIIHSAAASDLPDQMRLGQVGISSTRSTLAKILDRTEASPPQQLYPVRFLVGYAGWGPGQLERELKAGAWLQAQATDDLVFDCPWQQLWERASSESGFDPYLVPTQAQQYFH